MRKNHISHKRSGLNLAKQKKEILSEADCSGVIAMAWDDQTSFEDIFINYNYTEKDVISLMKKRLKRGSYRKWRQRVNGRRTKHFKKLQAHA